MLLHGFPDTSAAWRHQIPALVEAGYRVCAPDLRGYGGSDKPGKVSDYDLDPLSDDVAAMIRAIGAERAAVVGHDWGGGVAWHFAQRHPAYLTRLVVMNCPHPKVFADVLRTSFSQVRRSWYMFFFQIPWIPEWLTRRKPREFVERTFRGLAANKEAFTDADLDHAAKSIALPGAARGGINYYRAAFRKSPWQLKKRIEFWSTPIAVPTMLIWGLQDSALGQELIEPNRHLVSGSYELVEIQESSHWVQQEAPEQVNQALLRHLAPLLETV
jgi:pimeloyl-ACP methyl ester carboxylesterase